MEASVIFQTIIVPIGLFIIMMGLGLTLATEDITRVIIMPKAVLLGLFGQILLLPSVAFGLAFALNAPPVIAIGLVLLSACPGGITSNAYVFASRGDIALSVTLTTIASLFSVVTMPLLTWLALDTFTENSSTVAIPVQSMMIKLAQLTILPILIGMSVRKFLPVFAKIMLEPVRKTAIGILIIVIIGNTLFSIDTLKLYLMEAGLAAILLNIICMSLGYAMAKAAKLNFDQTIAITYEVGIQNLSLALTLAITILAIPEYAAVTLVYALFMKITSISFLAYTRAVKSRQ